MTFATLGPISGGVVGILGLVCTHRIRFGKKTCRNWSLTELSPLWFVKMNISTKSRQMMVSNELPVTEWSDEQLFMRYCQSGQRDCFSQLVRRYEKELYNYLRQYTGNSEMAEDAFQTTFLQVHLKCHQFDSSRKFRPWLYAIATNQAIDLQRRNRRHRAVSLNHPGTEDGSQVAQLMDLLESDEAGPLRHLQTAERRQWVQSALNGLPEHLRTVVLLVYFQGLKYREAADTLSIPVGTVKSRLHAAILKLNEAWYSTNTQLR